MSMGTWVITAAMCLIYAGFGALFTPIYDTVFATVAPGQNGRAVAMNDLAMQGSAAIGIGVFTPLLASGAFQAVALVCVVAAATGIAGDWLHEYLVPPRALSYFLTRGACARGARVVALVGVRLLVASSLS